VAKNHRYGITHLTKGVGELVGSCIMLIVARCPYRACWSHLYVTNAKILPVSDKCVDHGAAEDRRQTVVKTKSRIRCEPGELMDSRMDRTKPATKVRDPIDNNGNPQPNALLVLSRRKAGVC
jgi:hypothetical protein